MCRDASPHHRLPLQCILPPYILREIAKNGSDTERAAATAALVVDQTFRSRRLATTAPLRVARAVPGKGIAKPQRTIYDARSRQKLPGLPVRREGGKPSADVAVNEAYDGLGATFDFFLDVFQRNSIDNAGMPLQATVHYGADYDNAFWNGDQMVFGDGDGRLFNRFTIALDVIGHELVHGVTAIDGPLVYEGQAGALNESMSDVFGTLVKQYALGQDVNRADWLIGAGLLARGVNGVALRSMREPGSAYDDPVLGRDPQPAHLKDYVRTRDDSGGVHINSGIPNRAFFLAATAIGGRAWTRTGRIWYETLRDPKLKPNATFAAFAKLTVQAAERLFEPGSREAAAVSEAWQEVGVIKPK